MAANRCDSCGAQRPVAVLRRRPLTVDGADHELRLAEHPLCRRCFEWLTAVVERAKLDARDVPGLFGVPAGDGRRLVFDDQCHVCRSLLRGRGALLECATPGAWRASWPQLLACVGCDAWIASLADDGRSARGSVDRLIDGPYGRWPHPRLRDLEVELDVPGQATRAAIVTVCAEMGVRMAATTPAAGAILLVEAGGGRATRRLLEDKAPRPGRVVLAVLGARDDLVGALLAGATEWLTVPPTPQQLTAALAQAIRPWVEPRSWDEATGLPILRGQPVDRPMLVATPRAGEDPFEVAWLLKRLLRGYDDIGVEAGGAIAVLPRVPERDLERVAARLGRLLAGRCDVEPATGRAPRRRLDAAG